MKIKKIEINNYKSIKHLLLDASDLNAIIGPNSSGKSNVLKAIDLVLGEGWATKAKVARELFNDTDKEIFIKIDFDGTIPWVYYDRDLEIECITLRMQLQPLECSVRIWTNYPYDRKGEGYYLNDSFKQNCHFIYIPSERNLISELRVSEWTMLGKLMKLIYENYISFKGDEPTLKAEFAENMKPAKDYLEADFNESVTYSKFVECFKKYCKHNSAGLANDFKPILDIYNLNWFYKTLQIHVKEDHSEKHFDSDKVGAGMQNLLMLSIFQTYAELMGGNVIFGIEEPEIYLYPQAQRALYKKFIDLSDNTQIFYSTHNQNFVDAARPNDMILLRKSKIKGTYSLEKKPHFNNDQAETDKHRIYTQFTTDRNELFFAKKAVLVEGAADKILFSILCEEKWGIDLDSSGVSIISCGGKGGVNYFVGVCRLIGLNQVFAIWDEDDDDYKPTENWLSTMRESSNVIEIPGNLESYLGLPVGSSADKVKNAYEWAMEVDAENIPDQFINLKDFLSESPLKTDVTSNNEVDDIPF